VKPYVDIVEVDGRRFVRDHATGVELSTAQVARMIGIADDTVRTWLSRKRRPRPETLELIGRFLLTYEWETAVRMREVTEHVAVHGHVPHRCTSPGDYVMRRVAEGLPPGRDR
jgi:transcriptional regulator with XRE-family HTH domain